MSGYFFWMMLASALGFGKMLVLAQVLHPADFGAYVSLFGLAALSGMVLSFGQVEGTIKHFPRLWATGAKADIPRHATRIALSQCGRFTLLGIAVAVLAILVDIGVSPLTAVMTVALGLVTSLLSLLASIFRASDNVAALQNFTVTRSILALSVSCLGALLFGWQGALAGDVAAAALAIGIATLQIRSLSRAEANDDTLPPSTIAVDGGGRLYIANVLSSSMSLVDRSMVNAALGAATAGAYGVVGLLYQVGQLTMGILSQRMGPLIIRAKFIGSDNVSGLAICRRAATGQAILASALVVGMLGLRWLGWPVGFFEKYDISVLAILLAGGVCVMQIFQLLEFVLIAKDLERSVLTASGASSIAFFSLAGLAWAFQSPLESFVAAILVARTLQVALLLHAIVTKPALRPLPPGDS